MIGSTVEVYYTGEWRDELANGWGIEESLDGSEKYVGFFSGGYKATFGTFNYYEGDELVKTYFGEHTAGNYGKWG